MTRPPIPAPPFAGGCLCGAVRYRIEARPKAVNACHCMDCKKLTGGAHLLMLLVDHDAFLHERGEIHTFRKLADSGREIDIVRCARCGVRMWHAPLVNPEFVLTAAGTLDDPSWVSPASHIWTRSADPAVTMEPDTFRCEGQPETRQMMIDAFARLYGEG